MLYDETTESLTISTSESSHALQKLPNWVVTNKFPAFYDTESLTAIEQTARLYGATNKLIESYNTFVSLVDDALLEFDEKYQQDKNVFALDIRQTIQDFFDSVETQLQLQDAKIESVEQYLITNLAATINAAIASGKLKIDFAYNEETEELLIVAS